MKPEIKALLATIVTVILCILFTFCIIQYPVIVCALLGIVCIIPVSWVIYCKFYELFKNTNHV